MNFTLKTAMLLSMFFFAASFKSGDAGNLPRFKHEGYFTASIDGRPFDTRNYEKYTAGVISQSEYSKTDQSADLTFYGANNYDGNGNVYEESLQFKYILNQTDPAGISSPKMVFMFDNQKFLSVAGKTNIKVTNVHYAEDKTSMVVSLDFDAEMTQWAAPGQAQPVIHIKGKMKDINVSVPASATPTADLQ